MRRRFVLATVAVLSVALASPAMAGPTCSDSTIIDVEVHGQHIIGDYVLGVGHGNLGWPPARQVGGGGGVAVKGGPGPGFHFTIPGLAPGASFCTDRAPFATPGPFLP
jgi:hypothetical protein